MSRFVNLEFEDENGNFSPENSALFSKDEAYYFNEAQSAFQNGNFERALRLYSKVLEFNPRNASAWTGQVRMLIELEEFREAVLWADKALEQFPNEPELLAAKGVALARVGDLQNAIAFSDASVEERGNTPYIWLARGDVLLARRESRADYCFEKAMGLAPGDWFIKWLAARIRSHYKQFAAALKILQQAIEQNSGHFFLWLELGKCQLALCLPGPARHSFHQAEQLQPNHPEVKKSLKSLSRVGITSRFLGWCRSLYR